MYRSIIQNNKVYTNLKFMYIILCNCSCKTCMGMHGVKLRHSNVQCKLQDLTIRAMLFPTNTFTFSCTANHFSNSLATDDKSASFPTR